MATVESIERARQDRDRRVREREEENGIQAEQSANDAFSDSQAAIENSRLETQDRAHIAYQARLNQQYSEERLTTLYEENSKFRRLAATELAFFFVCYVALVAIYELDCLLFGPTALYLANKRYPNQPEMIKVFTSLIPLFVIVVEVFFAIRIANARNNTQNERTPFGAYLGAGFAALIMPALIGATQLMAMPKEPTSRQLWTTILFTFGFAGLSLVVHGLILFGGRRLRDAVAFPIYKIQELWLRGWSNSHNRRRDRETLVAAESLETHRQAVERHITLHPNSPVELGPFSQITCDIINDHYGRQYIVGAQNNGDPNRPDDNNNNPPNRNNPPNSVSPFPSVPLNNPATGPQPLPQRNPSPPAESPSDVTANGENEYLRSILTRQVRDAEDEVQP